MKILTVFLILLFALPFSSVANGSGSARAKYAGKLSSEYKSKGFPIVCEAVGNNNSIIKITQKNLMQREPLTDGQMITVLGTYLNNGIQSKLRNMGFESGLFVDGRSRNYKFKL